jgi:hypothetical protein
LVLPFDLLFFAPFLLFLSTGQAAHFFLPGECRPKLTANGHRLQQLPFFFSLPQHFFFSFGCAPMTSPYCIAEMVGTFASAIHHTPLRAVTIPEKYEDLVRLVTTIHPGARPELEI